MTAYSSVIITINQNFFDIFRAFNIYRSDVLNNDFFLFINA